MEVWMTTMPFTEQYRPLQARNHTWEFIPGDSAIKSWSRELSQMAKTAEPGDWDAAGHGVILEIEDPQEALPIAESIANLAGLAFHHFSADVMMDAEGDLRACAMKGQPSLIFLERGSWQDGTESSCDQKNGPSIAPEDLLKFRKSLETILLEIVVQKPLVVLTDAKSFSDLNHNFRRLKLFDRRIKVNQLRIINMARCFVQELGMDVVDISMVEHPERLGHLLVNEYPDRRRRELCQVALIRKARREKRNIRFGDLVQYVAHGTVEEDNGYSDDECLRRTAIHEAGHAVISHLDSEDLVAPEYCSISRRTNCFGTIVPSFASLQIRRDDPSFNDIAHKIRSLIAGRVAEDMFLGPGISSAYGATSDLETATSLARKMFSEWGYSANQPAANLAIFQSNESDRRKWVVEEKVRKYLAEQYEVTQKILSKNTPYLQRIIDSLLKNTVLFAEDIHRIYEGLDCHKRAA